MNRSRISPACLGLVSLMSTIVCCLLSSVATSGQISYHAANAAKSRQPITFTRDIAPIMYRNCAVCHHPGAIGPFSLLSYEQVQMRARQIAQVTQTRYMPPWHAASHGEFMDERHLTTEQINLIRQWVEAGTPYGSPADLPAAPAFHEGWTLGPPDAVFKPRAAYKLAAEGPDAYRCFVLPTHFSEDRYITAMDIEPGNPAIVHHIVVCVDTTGKARRLEQQDGGPGYTPHGNGTNPTGAIGVWGPGSVPSRFPEGVGALLPKGADIVLQVHYTRSGKPETDLPELGLYFCKGLVDKRARLLLLVQSNLRIPPGDANYIVRAFPTAACDDVTILQVIPHMHLLGREMTVSAMPPGKPLRPLIYVPDWDFHWQMAYTFKEPVKLPRGTILTMTARYDNSVKNLRNPNNPPRTVLWGALSTDEMCIAILIYTSDSEHLTQGKVSEGFPTLVRF